MILRPVPIIVFARLAVVSTVAASAFPPTGQRTPARPIRGCSRVASAFCASGETVATACYSSPLLRLTLACREVELITELEVRPGTVG